MQKLVYTYHKFIFTLIPRHYVSITQGNHGHNRPVEWRNVQLADLIRNSIAVQRRNPSNSLIIINAQLADFMPCTCNEMRKYNNKKYQLKELEEALHTASKTQSLIDFSQDFKYIICSKDDYQITVCVRL